MKIDYSKIMSYEKFEKIFATTIDSELYDFIDEKANYIKEKKRTPYERIIYIRDYFRNEKNAAYKLLVTVNCLFNEQLIFRALEVNNTNLEDFIAELSKVLTFSKIVNISGKASKKVSYKDELITNVFGTIAKWHAFQDYSLIALKIYEMKYKALIKEDKTKTK